MINRISPRQLFFIVFVSRTVVCLTFIQAVSIGKFSADLLISFFVSYLLIMLLSLPVVFCVKYGNNPFDNKVLRLFYTFYFLLSCALTVSRFSYFATTRMNPQMSMLVFIIVSFVAVGYSAYLGIEALGRFAGFCAVLLVIAVGTVVLCNLDNFNNLNFYPIFENPSDNIIKNTLLFMSNSVEPALFLCLSKNTGKSGIKAFYLGVSMAYFTIFLLLFFTLGVLGKNAGLQTFPIFSLFQMASVFDFSRMDMLHTSFWVMAMFLKSSTLIYSASKFSNKFKDKTRIIIVVLVAFLLSVFINFVVGTSIITVAKYVTFSMFVLLTVIIPLIYLLVRRNANEKD